MAPMPTAPSIILPNSSSSRRRNLHNGSGGDGWHRPTHTHTHTHRRYFDIYQGMVLGMALLFFIALTTKVVNVRKGGIIYTDTDTPSSLIAAKEQLARIEALEEVQELKSFAVAGFRGQVEEEEEEEEDLLTEEEENAQFAEALASTSREEDTTTTTSSTIGSPVDHDAALLKAKARIAAEQSDSPEMQQKRAETLAKEQARLQAMIEKHDAEDQRRQEEENAKLKVLDDRMVNFFHEEKSKALSWPTKEDLKLTHPPKDNPESGKIAPIIPAKDLKRANLTGTRPPLHRPWAEVKVEKVMVFVSSMDRGDRIKDLWGHGDKLKTMEVMLSSLSALCERGFEVSVWFVAAWKIADEGEVQERVNKALYCERIGKVVETRYWDDYNPAIEGALAVKHRHALKEVIDDYDFFISLEDDIYFRPIVMDAFIAASARLALVEEEEEREGAFPGFVRMEHDLREGKSGFAVWETDEKDYEGVWMGEKAGWFGMVGGNRHQGMWMATREQLYHFNDRCNCKWFDVEEGTFEWVEWWSGALQIWNDCAGGIQKVIPISTFREMSMWHMTDTKLGLMGKGITPVDVIVETLHTHRQGGKDGRLFKEKKGTIPIIYR